MTNNLLQLIKVEREHLRKMIELNPKLSHSKKIKLKKYFWAKGKSKFFWPRVTEELRAD